MTDQRSKAAVIGWPVSHSLSPALHRYWLNAYGINGIYDAMPVEAKDLERALAAFQAQGFAGINVTVPHKEAVVPFLSYLDPVASALGAVNLITFESDGRLSGRNTDGLGFLENVAATASGLSLAGRRAVVFGAGGTAKAVAYALRGAGARVALVNRTLEKAQAIAAQFGDIDVVPWAERNDALSGAALLVNTTTLGMAGQPNLEADLSGLASDAVVADCVYAPLETNLLKAAKTAGLTPVDGLGMLIHQARPAFEAWFGVLPVATPDLWAHLVKAQKELAT